MRPRLFALDFAVCWRAADQLICFRLHFEENQRYFCARLAKHLSRIEQICSGHRDRALPSKRQNSIFRNNFVLQLFTICLVYLDLVYHIDKSKLDGILGQSRYTESTQRLSGQPLKAVLECECDRN
jgi:hypothetical protein